MGRPDLKNGTNQTRVGIPFSSYLSLRIGDLEIGTADLISADAHHTPQAFVSMEFTRCGGWNPINSKIDAKIDEGIIRAKLGSLKSQKSTLEAELKKWESIVSDQNASQSDRNLASAKVNTTKGHITLVDDRITGYSEKQSKNSSLIASTSVYESISSKARSNANALRAWNQCTFTMNTVPEFWSDLEYKIIKYCKDHNPFPVVKWKYGYVEHVQSMVYSGYITNITLSSDLYTIKIDVMPLVNEDGSDPGYVEWLSDSAFNSVMSRKYSRKSDLVRAIAKAQKWTIGEIVETVEEPSFTPDMTRDTDPSKYIITKLCGTGAVALNGSNGFGFSFVHTSKGISCFYKPTQGLPTIPLSTKSYNFIYNYLPNGQVISFNYPEVKIAPGSLSLYSTKKIEGKKDISAIMTDTGDMVTAVLDSSDPTLNFTVPQLNSDIWSIEVFNVTKNFEGYIMDNFYDYAYPSGYITEASLEVLGDPEIYPNDYINVIVMYGAFSSSNARGMHPSSGTYMVLRVTDSIVGGVYTTTLSLTRVALTGNMQRVLSFKSINANSKFQSVGVVLSSTDSPNSPSHQGTGNIPPSLNPPGGSGGSNIGDDGSGGITSGDDTPIISSGSLIWPLPGYTRISSPYGYRIHPIRKTRSFHSGIDIPAPSGTPIKAANGGKVSISTNGGGYGNYVQVDHPDGKSTRYAHMVKRAVSVGQKVSQGQVIGYVGTTGNSTGNHLHFEVRIDGATQNPRNYVSPS